MADAIHLAPRSRSKPACRDRDPAARLTSHPDLVTCEPCKATPAFATQVRDREAQRKRYVPRSMDRSLKFANAAERDWYGDGRIAASPAERVLIALLQQEDVTLDRLRWGWTHAVKGSTAKALLGVRLRAWLGLAADAPLERTTAHG